MERTWTILILSGCVCACATGRGAQAGAAVLGSGRQAMELLLTLTGAMTLWSGLLGILERTGDVERMGQKLRLLLKPLFPGVQDEAAWGAIGLNLAANMAGLGNAATPAGIDAARRLAALGDAGLRALAMLLALNNSSLQLLPTTVLSLRAEAGAAAPADIWPASLASSLAATVTAALLMALVQRKERRHG